MKTHIQIICLGTLLLCAGCGTSNRYYRWIASQFSQVCIPHKNSCFADAYIQSQDRYDGFNTVGHYDVLWYAAPVRMWHIDRMQEQFGWTDADTEKETQKYAEDDKKMITFYALMSQDNSEAIRPRLTHRSKDAQKSLWGATLIIDGRSYPITEIKKTLLPSAFTYCFGDRFDFHYRTIYRISCPRVQDNKDILADAHHLELRLNTIRYEISFCWPQTLVHAGSEPMINNECSETPPDNSTAATPPAHSPEGVQEVRI